MELFARFAIAMDFVAIAVLERELHKLIGLSSWRLAHHSEEDASIFGVYAAIRAATLRRRATLGPELAVYVHRTEAILRRSRHLLDATREPRQSGASAEHAESYDTKESAAG